MHMKLFRKLLVIWMMVWLPVAGAMAAVMPLSGSLAAVLASNTTPGADEDMSLMPCHGKGQSATLAFGHGCSHCVLCHLAGALVIPEMPIITASVPTHIFAAASVTIPPSFIAELTAPPPRASLA
jgi:hypothetical protein